MTLIVTLPVKEGIVLASDSQLTMGIVRATGSKIYRLNESCVWAASGELALIQRVEEELGSLSTNQPLQECRTLIAQAVGQAVTNLLREDFRTQFFSASSEELLDLHKGDFVFAEFTDTGPRVLHMVHHGTSEWVNDIPLASGSGDLFAYALLGKFDLTKVTLEMAKVLAIKVIEEAIHVGAYGLGSPIKMYEIVSGKADEIQETELARLSDTARTIREWECRFFYENFLSGSPESDSTQPTS